MFLYARNLIRQRCFAHEFKSYSQQSLALAISIGFDARFACTRHDITFGCLQRKDEGSPCQDGAADREDAKQYEEREHAHILEPRVFRPGIVEKRTSTERRHQSAAADKDLSHATVGGRTHHRIKKRHQGNNPSDDRSHESVCVVQIITKPNEYITTTGS